MQATNPEILKMISNSRLFNRALYQVSPVSAISGRPLPILSRWKVFDRSKPSNHVTQKNGESSVQHDAWKLGKAERASGGGSAATSEKDKDNENKKAQEDHPEAPGVVIGMNDERGGVSTSNVVNVSRLLPIWSRRVGDALSWSGSLPRQES
jgi:hypothetical protein